MTKRGMLTAGNFKENDKFGKKLSRMANVGENGKFAKNIKV